MDFLISALLWALGISASLIAIGLIAWKIKLIRVVTVQEATAVAFKYQGKFVYCAMQFSGHHFDRNNGFICEGPGDNEYGSCWCVWRLGGWVFYIHPFIAPAKYLDHNDPDSLGEGIFVRLNDQTTSLVVNDQKTIAPENVGLNVQFVGIEKVVNPFRWLFMAPKNAKTETDKRVITALRLWIESHKQEYIQISKGNGVQLWDELLTKGFQSKVDDARNWGLEINKNSIAVEKVDYSNPAYAAALEANSQAGLLAQAEAARIGAIDRAMDQWIKAEARRMKKPQAEALTILKADGSWSRQRDIYMSQILADANANLLLVGNPDGTKLEGGLAPAIALFAAATSAKAGGRQQGNRGKNPGNGGRNAQRSGPPSDEPYKKAAEDFFAKYGVYPVWDPSHRTPVGDGIKKGS